MTGPASLRSTVETVLGKMGTRPRKRLGQNFMVNPLSLVRVVDAAGLLADDAVVEIGAGLGFLTERLAGAACRVIAVEKDKWFCNYLRRIFAGRPGVEIAEGDALEFDFTRFRDAPVMCVGNIPYQISSPLLERLEANRRSVRGAVLTVQKDFALRLAAKEGSRDRSALSTWMQLNAEIEILSDFAAADFYPAPKVISSLVRIRFLETPCYPPEAGEWIRRAIAAGFGQKRKNILNALTGSPIGRPKPEFAKILAEAGVPPTERAENLPGDAWVRIGSCLASACGTC